MGDSAVLVASHLIPCEGGIIVADGVILCEGGAFGGLMLGVILVLRMQLGLRWVRGTRIAVMLGLDTSGTSLSIVVVNSVTLRPVLA